jgi:RNA recognition motif. (a.k.a. RRM, RBD, or RNP domain)
MDHFREADVMEQWLGARRHDDLTILPDSMLETTLFVGNLCEFVTDQDLSRLFTQARVTFLQFVPACVMRKADLTSLQYGFVTFPSVKEKEVCLVLCVCVWVWWSVVCVCL